MTEILSHILEHGSPMGSTLVTVPGDAPVRLCPPQGAVNAFVSNRGNHPVLFTLCGCVPVRPYGAHRLAPNGVIEINNEAMWWGWWISETGLTTSYLFVTWFGQKPIPPS